MYKGKLQKRSVRNTIKKATKIQRKKWQKEVDVNAKIVKELLSKTDQSQLFGKNGLFVVIKTCSYLLKVCYFRRINKDIARR